jgi:hypothetical protein
MDDTRTVTSMVSIDVVPNVSAGTITIHLDKAPGKAVMVGWSVPN